MEEVLEDHIADTQENLFSKFPHKIFIIAVQKKCNIVPKSVTPVEKV